MSNLKKNLGTFVPWQKMTSRHNKQYPLSLS